MPLRSNASVCFVSTMISDPWGGSEVLWQKAALVLRENGFQVYVNVKEWPEKPKQIIELEAKGCRVERRKFYIHPSWEKRLSQKFNPSKRRTNTAYNIITYLKAIKADLIVISQGSNQDGVEWMEACASLKQRFITVSQAATESLWPNDDLADRLAKGFQSAKMNYFISQNNLNLTIKQTATQYTNTKVIRNPFHVPFDSNPDYPIHANYCSLACVGRILPDAKGQDILFEVLALEKWKNRPLRVNIYGEGPNILSLKRLASLWGLTNVVFRGFVSDVTQIWKTNQGLILPSRYEGLPLAVVEASLCGRISIVTDVAGNAEVINDMITGFIAKAPTALLLDEAMEAAWSKRADWQRMGMLAKEYIKQRVAEKPENVFADEIISFL